MNNGSADRIDKSLDSDSTDFKLKPASKVPSFIIPKIPISQMDK